MRFTRPFTFFFLILTVTNRVNSCGSIEIIVGGLGIHPAAHLGVCVVMIVRIVCVLLLKCETLVLECPRITGNFKRLEYCRSGVIV